jgi:hypothetical protein
VFIPDPDPDFYPSRIPDLTTSKKEEGKKFVVMSYFNLKLFYF